MLVADRERVSAHESTVFEIKLPWIIGPGFRLAIIHKKISPIASRMRPSSILLRLHALSGSFRAAGAKAEKEQKQGDFSSHKCFFGQSETSIKSQYY
jgi:hypothetical protein